MGKRTPRTSEVVQSISNGAASDEIWGKLSGLVERRINALEKSYGISGIRLRHHMLKHYKSDPSSLLSDSEFILLKRPTIETALAYAIEKGNNLKFIGGGSEISEVLVRTNRLIFKNSFNGKIESWARPYDVGIDYHSYPYPPTKDKSIFKKNLPRKLVYLKTFNNGLGYIKSIDQIFLYKKFDETVGKLKKTNVDAYYVKIQCDRVKRITGRGYRTAIHGYPVSDTEIKRDLKGYPTLLKQLDL